MVLRLGFFWNCFDGRGSLVLQGFYDLNAHVLALVNIFMPQYNTQLLPKCFVLYHLVCHKGGFTAAPFPSKRIISSRLLSQSDRVECVSVAQEACGSDKRTSSGHPEGSFPYQ